MFIECRSRFIFALTLGLRLRHSRRHLRLPRPSVREVLVQTVFHLTLRLDLKLKLLLKMGNEKLFSESKKCIQRHIERNRHNRIEGKLSLSTLSTIVAGSGTVEFIVENN